MAISKANISFYSRQGLWSLFLMCALPLHIWTIILAFRDFSWVTDRTNSWDAIGVMSYGLVFTFVESIAVFIASTALGILISNKWKEKRRIALSSVLIIVLSLWAMANHLYFLLETSLPSQIIGFFVGFDHPLRALYVVILILVTPTFLVPVYFLLKSEKFFQFIQEGIERLSLLMTLYLFLDLAALAVVLIRNIRG